MTALVWFRADLRVRDNTALAEACRDASGGAVAVFTVCPRQWREHDWADVKVDFILRTLGELRSDLGRLNIPLLITRADTFDQVPALLLKTARAHRCDAVYFNREYEINEARRDEAVTQTFADAGLEARAFHDQSVIPPGTLRTTTDRFYSVFTPYRRAWIRHLKERGVPAVRPRPRRRPGTGVTADALPKSVAGFDRARARPDLWPAGEHAARRRLRSFVETRIRDYARHRDRPALDGTSALSPYLAVGAISTRQCLQAAMAANGNSLNGRKTGAATWITELIWREFYRHLLVGYPRLSMGRAFRPETDRIDWNRDRERFDAWCRGRTGVPLVDAAMRQLEQTGWMHNRLRMITAMFLTKDLLIDWRWGERHFMRHLIDGDLASNNGGWQWSASTGADAAPYFRIFNPYRQSRKFDPQGAFIRRHVPELDGVEGDAIHDPSPLPGPQRSKLDYPPPIVDHTEAAARAVARFRELRAEPRQ
ncbi:MAG: deoxyribodipyrimidine photo-lyase [Planctomycetota bacterium]|jgi:deoxyribodipyrimidine photo-lyase